MARHTRLVLLLAVGVALGCGTSVSEINDSAISASAAGDLDRTHGPRVLNRLDAASHEADYRIGPEDLLEINFFELEDLHRSNTVQVRVSEQGEVMLPLLGNVRAAGRTTSEFRQEIEKQLAAKYLTEPQVNVSIREYKSKKVAVLGAVARPGVYKLTRNQSTLLHVLGLAGGPTEKAGCTLFLVRGSEDFPKARSGDVLSSSMTIDVPAPASGSPAESVYAVNLTQLLEKGQANLNLTVRTGDVVNVPEAGMAYVTGHVNKPGGFPLRTKTTVLQALSLAGGLKKTAHPPAARLVRRQDGREIILPVNLERIAEGKAPDVEMHENDVLQVPDSKLKNFSRGFVDVFARVFTVGVGLQ